MIAKPSVPVVMQLIRICKLPAERYFNPDLLREDSEQRQRTSHKFQLCPEKYLPIVEDVCVSVLFSHLKK